MTKSNAKKNREQGKESERNKVMNGKSVLTVVDFILFFYSPIQLPCMHHFLSTFMIVAVTQNIKCRYGKAA